MEMNEQGREATSPRPSPPAERGKRKNSRAKGARGERAWRDELRANGYSARRGCQFAGTPNSPDVACAELDWILFEVKAVERLNIYGAMEQARRDCGARSAECGVKGSTPHPSPLPDRGGEGERLRARKVPIVAHKRSHRRWLVTMDAETFFRLLRGDFPDPVAREDFKNPLNPLNPLNPGIPESK